MGRARFGRGMALGNRQPQHVPEGAGVPPSAGARGGEDLGGEDGLGTDDPSDRRERAGVFGPLPALDDVPVEVPPGKPDPDPHARNGHGVQGGRDGILELSVQVRQSVVDDDGRHRSTHRRLEAAGGVRTTHRPNLAASTDGD